MAGASAGFFAGLGGVLCIAACLLLCVRESRREAAWRAGLLADCAGVLSGPRAGTDRAGYAALDGGYEGAAVRLRLVPEALVHRRLPQLWLSVALRVPLATDATLDVLRRPAGTEFFSPSDRLPTRYAVPAGWPADTLLRGTPGAEALRDRAAPVLARILADPRVKEVLLRPDGLRIVVQASEGARGSYLLLRASRFPLAQVPPARLRAVLRDGLALASTLAEAADARAAA